VAKAVQEQLAVVVDDNGRCRASFTGKHARQEAEGFRQDCANGGVDFMRHSTTVVGKDAKQCYEEGRI